MVFNLNRKMHSWLIMRIIDFQKLYQSSKLNSSASSKSDRIEGKVKLTELLAQEAFLEKHQHIESEVQRLKM